MRNLRDLVAQIEERAIRSRIKQARKEAGLTQEQIADLLGIKDRTYQNYERADEEGRTPWQLINAIAAVTDKSQEWLLHGHAASSEGSDPNAIAALVAAEIRSVLQPLERQLADLNRLNAKLVAEQNQDRIRAKRVEKAIAEIAKARKRQPTPDKPAAKPRAKSR